MIGDELEAPPRAKKLLSKYPTRGLRNRLTFFVSMKRALGRKKVVPSRETVPEPSDLKTK